MPNHSPLSAQSLAPLRDGILQQIVEQARPLVHQGQVASYIPALALVPAEHIAIAVCTADGEVFAAGDSQQRFSIQSISKLFSLVVAMTRYSETELWQRVGKEPSGQPFNSLMQLELERGVPRNPFINAGALVVCDMLQSRLSAPKQRMLEMLRQLSGAADLHYDPVIARSELEHSDRNAAISYLMKSFGNFHNPVPQVLDSYFHYCALKMNVVELARAANFLANRGWCQFSQQRWLSEKQSRQVNALLATCGLYDGAGDFAYRVGMPGKSGVGGGIVCVVPGQMTIAVWSPSLDKNGNTVAGVAMLEQLAEQLGFGIF